MKKSFLLLVLLSIIKLSFGQWQHNDILDSKDIDFMFKSNQSIFMYSNDAGSLFRSDDNGLTWAKKLTIPPIITGYSVDLVNYFILGDTIILCNHNKVFRSFDNANSWSFSTISNALLYFFIDDVLYCQTTNASGSEFPVFSSSDYGLSWTSNSTSILNQTKIQNTAKLFDTTYALIGFSPIQICRLTNIDNFDTIHTFSQSNFPYKLVSNNEKMIVLSIENSLIIATVCDDFGAPNLNNFEISNAATSMYIIHDTILVIADNKFLLTTDYGQSWSNIEVLPNGYLSKGFYQINNVNYALYDNIILRNSGLNNWETITDVTFPPTMIHNFKIVNTVFHYSLYNVLCKKSHYQNDSKVISPLINDSIQLVELQSFQNLVVGLNYYHGFYKSSDDGEIWSYMDFDLPFNDSVWSGYHYVFLESNDTLFFYVNNSFDISFLFYSVDNGNNWTKIFNSESSNYLVSYSGHADVFFKINEYLFIGNNYNGNYIRLRYQNGVIESATSYYQNQSQIFHVGDVLFKSKPHIIGNQTTLSFEKSDDYGDNWQSACYGLPNYQFCTNCHHFMGNDSIMFCYIEHDNSIYSSFDKGSSWFSIVDNLIGETLTSAYFYNDTVYVNVAHKGVYARSMFDINPICVSGKIFIDMNGNNQFDANSDQPLENINVYSSVSSSNNMSNQSGNYSVFLSQPTNFDTIRALNTILYSSVYPEYYIVNQSDTSKNFAISRIPGINDLRVDITSTDNVRAGTEYQLYITCKNEGSTILNGQVVLSHNDFFQYQSSLITPSQINQSSIVWDLQNLEPLQSHSFYVKFSLDITIMPGQPVQMIASLFPIIDDETPENNIDSLSNVIVGSYDPNDKTVNRPLYLNPQEVLNKSEMIYTIRFQNTGTWYAENVSILDTLHRNLDWSSFRVISSSHDYNFDFSGNGVVQFNFPNINLPDSNMNEAASHGFIKYSIRLNNSIQPNDSITNTAYIYFDYNEPIVTNTALNIVKIDAAINENTHEFNLSVYPNPAKTSLNIRFEESSSYNLTLFSIDGRIVLKEKSNSEHHVLNIASLENGIYLLRVSDADRSKVIKIVKQ